MDKTLTLKSPCGARAEVAHWGGQLLSWVPAGGAERLYSSPASNASPGKALRGGVPVIFPQFADLGPGPRHGIARTRAWQVIQHETGRDDALATLRLESDGETLALWPHRFALELTVRIQRAVLEMELSVENLDTAPMQFQAALHSYWRVADAGRVVIDGLQDRPYRDAATGAKGVQHSRRLELLTGRAIDRLVSGPGGPLVLTELDSGRALLLEPEGFENAVIWNPGPEHQLPDLPRQDWQHFLCLEAGQIQEPVTLLQGESWLARQRAVAN